MTTQSFRIHRINEYKVYILLPEIAGYLLLRVFKLYSQTYAHIWPSPRARESVIPPLLVAPSRLLENSGVGGHVFLDRVFLHQTFRPPLSPFGSYCTIYPNISVWSSVKTDGLSSLEVNLSIVAISNDLIGSGSVLK